jgi:hypothetical protein
VVGFVFYFALGPFFAAGLVGRRRGLGDGLLGFLPSGDWLLSLEILK